MTNADWWARVVLLPQFVWALRNGEHEAAIDLKAVPGIGAEIVLTVDGEWRKTTLFRAHEQAELVGAIEDTRAMFEGKGWNVIIDSPVRRLAHEGIELLTTGER
jgi:hypothetical protein